MKQRQALNTIHQLAGLPEKPPSLAKRGVDALGYYNVLARVSPERRRLN